MSTMDCTMAHSLSIFELTGRAINKQLTKTEPSAVLQELNKIRVYLQLAIHQVAYCKCVDLFITLMTPIHPSLISTMDKKSFHRLTLYFVGAVTASILSILFWDHFHAGVPSHHLLADENLPEISNWWGAISLPLTSYFLLSRIKNRIILETQANGSHLKRKFLLPFLVSLAFALILAISYTIGHSEISGIMFQALFLIAVLLPVYKSEYLLGFIIGLAYTFGGVLPIVIASFFAILSYAIHVFVIPLFKKMPVLLGRKK